MEIRWNDRSAMKVTSGSFQFHPSFKDIRERKEICRQEGYDESFAGEPVNFFEMGGEHPSVCFLCGEKLTVPCVMWVGPVDIKSTAGELWLHRECAREFGEKLVEEYNRNE
jgi:hypothetical protein